MLVFKYEFILNHLIKNMKIIKIILFVSLGTAQNIPYFDGDLAFSYLVKQCEFGPRYPGSNEHIDIKDYFIEFLDTKADELIIYNHNIKHPYEENDIVLYNILARYNKLKNKVFGPEDVVPVQTLDSHHFENVGLIKIDTQGHELRVLRGGIETLEKNKPVVVFEINEDKDYITEIAEQFEAQAGEVALSPDASTGLIMIGETEDSPQYGETFAQTREISMSHLKEG